MNCPNCGAENEADARFCGECGAPLETYVPPLLDDDDEDATILSTVDRIAEEAKTVNVNQEEIAAAAEAEAEVIEVEKPEEPVFASQDNSSSAAGGLFTQRNIIIAVVVLIVLCCICTAIGLVVPALAGI
ncbi:MAG: zinc ribbon domain-containing protein [Chloroflexota bacterium]